MTIQLAVDGIHGIYTPQRFFIRYPQFLDRLSDEEQAIVNNPEHADYWDVWETFVRDFEVMKENERWFLHCDEDVFFVSEHHNFND